MSSVVNDQVELSAAEKKLIASGLLVIKSFLAGGEELAQRLRFFSGQEGLNLSINTTQINLPNSFVSKQNNSIHFAFVQGAIEANLSYKTEVYRPVIIELPASDYSQPPSLLSGIMAVSRESQCRERIELNPEQKDDTWEAFCRTVDEYAAVQGAGVQRTS